MDEDGTKTERFEEPKKAFMQQKKKKKITRQDGYSKRRWVGTSMDNL